MLFPLIDEATLFTVILRVIVLFLSSGSYYYFDLRNTVSICPRRKMFKMFKMPSSILCVFHSQFTIHSIKFTLPYVLLAHVLGLSHLKLHSDNIKLDSSPVNEITEPLFSVAV